ncbi:MAG: hypothetical protein KJ945_12060 [Gammaproteobacteria bacterium]|nr:hypothetical protein [Gammaproteobacteria bacterium]
MQTRELSLVGKLDNGLAKGLCLLLGWLKTASLWWLGLLTLASLPLLIFEYGEGLADLSLLEWAFMPLLALLIWRHVRYCRHFTTGIWRGLNRLLICQGIMSALGLLLVGLLTAVMVQTDNLQELLSYLTQDDPISKFVNFCSVLLAAYLAPPTAGITTLSMPKAATIRVEPTVTQAAKEASL